MKLSIIIPAFNAEKYIEKCLRSIGKHGDLEIIVINDGSLDKTKDLVLKYKNVKLYNNTNHGVSYSRNFGINKATGDYVMFVDADDYLKVNYLNFLNKRFTEDVIYFNKNLVINEKENLFDYITGFKKPCIAGPCCKLFRLDFLKKNKIFFKEDIINGEDMLFNIECALKLDSYKVINESIYMYRQNINSATKTYNEKILESDKKFHKYFNEMIKDKEELIVYNMENAIVTLVDRMVYIKSYREFKNKVEFLKEKPYKEFLKGKYVSFKGKLLILLLKLKLYHLVYNLLKINHKKYYENKEYFIEI